jgi:hypothetical protein
MRALNWWQVPLAAKLVVGAVAGVVGTSCIFPIGQSDQSVSQSVTTTCKCSRGVWMDTG